MLTRYIARGIYLLLLSISSVQAGYLPPPSPFPPAENPFYLNGPVVRQLGYFTNIVISGNIDVDIKTGVQNSEVVLTGDKETIKQVQISQKNGTLTMGLAPQFFVSYSGPARVHAEILTHYLNNLTLKKYSGHLQAINLNVPYFNANLDHSGTVLLSGKIGLDDLKVSGSGVTKIAGVDSESLSIYMQDKPAVDMTGVANVQLINASGSGRLRLYWVDSSDLSIVQSGKTWVELAGIANHVMIHLKDSAHFDGRYLRTIVGYAKTQDKSVADVQFLRSQAVLANDNSTISFYGQPPYKADFMARNGAVLDMDDH